MACPWVTDGGDGLQIWWVAVNIFNKQLVIDSQQQMVLQLGGWARG
jgi:hypothetical protein